MINIPALTEYAYFTQCYIPAPITRTHIKKRSSYSIELAHRTSFYVLALFEEQNLAVRDEAIIRADITIRMCKGKLP